MILVMPGYGHFAMIGQRTGQDAGADSGMHRKPLPNAGMTSIAYCRWETSYAPLYNELPPEMRAFIDDIGFDGREGMYVPPRVLVREGNAAGEACPFLEFAPARKLISIYDLLCAFRRFCKHARLEEVH